MSHRANQALQRGTSFKIHPFWTPTETLDIHVDTNGTELKKLPKYAVAFGNLMPSERSAEASVLEETTNTQLPTPPPSNVKSGAAVYDPSGNLFGKLYTHPACSVVRGS